MKNRFIAALLICAMTLLCSFILNSCNITDDNNYPDTLPSGSDETDGDETEDNFELSTPVEDDRAIIHMIKHVSELEDWQVGKTEFHAFYYINDMMEIFDALEWNNGDIVNLSGDFDFRIDIYRPLSELDEFEKFFDRIDGENEKDEETKAEPEETKAEDTETPEDTPEDRKLAVQYLINYKDRVINMRFSDYSAQKFDVYAEMSESEMKMIILCLKYYFGPSR